MITFARAKEKREYLRGQAAASEAENSTKRGSAPGISAHTVTVAEGRSLHIDTTNGACPALFQ